MRSWVGKGGPGCLFSIRHIIQTCCSHPRSKILPMLLDCFFVFLFLCLELQVSILCLLLAWTFASHKIYKCELITLDHAMAVARVLIQCERCEGSRGYRLVLAQPLRLVHAKERRNIKYYACAHPASVEGFSAWINSGPSDARVTKHPYACCRWIEFFTKPAVDETSVDETIRSHNIPLRCNVSFIGQTARCLNNLILKHKRAVKSNASNSEIAKVVDEYSNFEPEWGSTELLRREKESSRRVLREIMHMLSSGNLETVSVKLPCLLTR